MRRSLFAAGVAGLLGLPFTSPCASAHEYPERRWETPGSLVSLSVELDGRSMPLFPAPDGSGRYYVEARRGARYTVRLDNRTAERLGVALTVDGLNVISGQKETGSGPGRMYVLDPWDTTVVQGWRTSLDAVQRFTFVDEQRSYATRSGKANAKMGWIEVAVYRERHPYVERRREVSPPTPYGYDDRADKSASESGKDEAPRASGPPAAASPAPRDGEIQADGSGQRRAYPGTGWGPREDDPAVVVRFDPQPYAAERLTVRYEYASGLRALGILPESWPPRDRLWEREHAREGFAQPPR
jgi:hypothetical protein